MKKLIIPFIFLLFFLGCVAETIEYAQKSETVEMIYLEDFDRDDVIDRTVYSFEPVIYGDETFVKRYILESYVYDLSEVTVEFSKTQDINYTIKKQTLPQSVITGLKNDLDSFKQTKSASEKESLRQLGLYDEITDNIYYCSDQVSCLRRCHTPKCELGRDTGGAVFINQMIDLSISIQELNKDINSLEVYLNNNLNNNLTDEGISELYGKIKLVGEKSNAVNTNPLVSAHAGALKISSPIDYRIEYLNSMINKIEKNTYLESEDITTQGASFIYRSPPLKSVEYVVILESYHNSNSPYVSIILEDEVIPGAENVLISSNYTNVEDGKISWKLSQVGGQNIPGYVVYGFSTKTPINNQTLSKLQSPKISVTKAEVEQSIWVLYSLDIINGLTGMLFIFGAYFSIGIFFGLLGVLARLIVWGIEFLWELIVGILSKKELKKIFYEWMGLARPDYIQYAGLAILLIIFSAILCFGADVQYFKDLDSFLQYLFSNIIGTIGAFLVFLSILSLYFSLEEYIKLKVFLRPVSENDLKERNLKSLDHLNEQISKIYELLHKASSLRIDASEERESLLSIPVKRVTQLINEVDDQSQARVLVEQAISRAEYCTKSLEQKINFINAKWPEWESIISELLNKKQKVSLGEILDIPKEWRELALERFLILHPEKNLIIEKNILRPITGKDKRVPLSKLPFPAAKFTITGEPDNYPFESGNSNLIGTLIHRMMSSVKLLDTPTSHVDIKGIFVKRIDNKGEQTTMIFVGNKIILGKYSNYSFSEILKKILD
ncbi:hypothetical protein KO465_00240 [Candidatus Micrarchaeota archaeon]|nr:hypothetical protein [Candidatus Micrarchaeota archaeon]